MSIDELLAKIDADFTTLTQRADAAEARVRELHAENIALQARITQLESQQPTTPTNPDPIESPEGAIVLNDSGKALIVDGETWEVKLGIAFRDAVATPSSNVVSIQRVFGRARQTNAAGGSWDWVDGKWVEVGQVTPEPEPQPIPTPTGFITGMNVAATRDWDYATDPTKIEHFRGWCKLLRCMKWTTGGDIAGMTRSVNAANDLKSDLWVALNITKSDADIKTVLQYAKANYNVPGGRIWVSPGNEIWNPGEHFTDFVMQKAGVTTRSGDDNVKFLAEWARQALRCFRLAREVIPNCHRVLEVFTSNTWSTEQLLKTVKDEYDVLSPTFYVANTARGTVDEIIAAAMKDASPGSKDYSDLKWHTDKAHSMGKLCVCYEGQLHVNAKSAGSATVSLAVSKDPRGADIIRRMNKSMAEIGVDGMAWFAFVVKDSNFPFSLFNTPKWDVVKGAA